MSQQVSDFFTNCPYRAGSLKPAKNKAQFRFVLLCHYGKPKVFEFLLKLFEPRMGSYKNILEHSITNNMVNLLRIM